MDVLTAVLEALLTAAVDRQTEVDAMMRKYGIGGNGRVFGSLHIVSSSRVPPADGAYGG